MRLSTADIPENRIQSFKRVRGHNFPVTREEVKAWSRVTYAYEDHEMDVLLDMAIEEAEDFCNTSFVDSEITVVYSSYGNSIPLLYGPVDEITSVERDGAAMEYDLVGDYLEPRDLGGRLTVKYKTAAESSARAKVAIMKVVATAFEDRQDTASGSVTELPNSSRMILRRLKR